LIGFPIPKRPDYVRADGKPARWLKQAEWIAQADWHGALRRQWDPTTSAPEPLPEWVIDLGGSWTPVPSGFVSESMPAKRALAIWGRPLPKGFSSCLTTLDAAANEKRAIAKAGDLDPSATLTRRIARLHRDTWWSAQFADLARCRCPQGKPAYTSVDGSQTVVITNGPGWQLPVQLGLGGFNACPAKHVLGAIVRGWIKRFGVRVLHVGDSSLELACPRLEPKQCRELVTEAAAVAPDTATDTYGGLSEWATAVARGSLYLWWD